MSSYKIKDLQRKKAKELGVQNEKTVGIIGQELEEIYPTLVKERNGC